ncbi:MAG: glycoside hydrolase family 127 protein [Phycisphaerae bacterium]|nr:glycoside hydrolase family 127 protein [Phycisphaerae bacterium]
MSQLAAGILEQETPDFTSVLLLIAMLACLCVSTTRAVDALEAIDVRQVKVGGEIGRRIDVTVNNNLMVLDAEKDFLQPFRERSKGGGYIGLGKLIDAMVRLAAYTGDEKVLARKRHVVSETIKTQGPDGYIGIMAEGKRVWPLWDVHEMSYLVYGLTMDHRFFGEKASLDAARKLADYIMKAWSAEPKRIPGGGEITLHMAVTGFEPALLALHQETGDPRYLDFVVNFRKVPEWDYPIVVGRWGDIGGHVYTYLCHCIAQLRLNRVQPQPRLLGPTRRAFDFMTRGEGLAVTGTCGDHECWHDSQAGTMNLGETCATAYLIRWLDELLRIEAKPIYGDLMERSIHNALFAAQSPDGRYIRYYSPFEGARTYFKGDTYCCPCNYRRIISELPTMVYYRAGKAAVVNLYTPSSATIDLADGVKLTLRQETDYPNSGGVALHVDPSKPAEFPVRLRIPRWCARAEVTVNGSGIGQAKAGSFFEAKRTWQKGDRVELRMDMPLRLVKGRVNQAGRVAIMRGPVVFCLSPARNPQAAKMDLRLITLDPTSVSGPEKDESVHPNGLACQIKAWPPGSWYPGGKPSLNLTLTEFPDPEGRLAYLFVPNPNDKAFVDDELIERD